MHLRKKVSIFLLHIRADSITPTEGRPSGKLDRLRERATAFRGGLGSFCHPERQRRIWLTKGTDARHDAHARCFTAFSMTNAHQAPRNLVAHLREHATAFRGGLGSFCHPERQRRIWLTKGTDARHDAHARCFTAFSMTEAARRTTKSSRTPWRGGSVHSTVRASPQESRQRPGRAWDKCCERDLPAWRAGRPRAC